MQLTKREDQIMQIIWRLKKAFIRDIVDAFPEPKPHYNTVATIVKILVKKGVLESELLGNTHQYQSTDAYEDYRQVYLGEVKRKYFGNSLPKMLAYFAKDEQMSEEEIAELIEIIKGKKN